MEYRLYKAKYNAAKGYTMRSNPNSFLFVNTNDVVKAILLFQNTPPPNIDNIGGTKWVDTKNGFYSKKFTSDNVTLDNIGGYDFVVDQQLNDKNEVEKLITLLPSDGGKAKKNQSKKNRSKKNRSKKNRNSRRR